MTIYIILIALIIILGLIFEKKNKKLYSILVFVLLTLVAGLRSYKIGSDSITYVRNFNNVLYSFKLYGMNIFSIDRFESGFLGLLLIVRNITENYNILFLIIHIFINFSICRFVRKYSHNMCFSFILFFLARFFFSEMNIMRQFIAISIFLFAIKYIEEKKFWKYAALIFIAFLFHKISIVLLPLYFLNRINLTTKRKIKLVIITVITYVFLYSILTKVLSFLGMYEGYLDSYYGSNKFGNIAGFLVGLCVYIFLKITMAKKDIAPGEKLLVNYYFIYVLLSFLCIRISILSRVTEFLGIFSIVLIPNAIYTVKEKNKRMLLYAIIFIFYCLYFYVIARYRPDWNTCIPYQFFWQL